MGENRGHKRKIDRVLEDLVAAQMKKAIEAASPLKRSADPGRSHCMLYPTRPLSQG